MALDKDKLNEIDLILKKVFGQNIKQSDLE
jgi:hypothetical protein